MANNTINAAKNPSLANDLINQAMATQEVKKEPALVTPPSDNLVHLPGGFITDAGEVIKTAEVRELTGRDEELISRSTNSGRTFSAILACGAVKVGDIPVTEKVLDELLSGDRDAIMVGIYKATFGQLNKSSSFCRGCGEMKDIEVDVDTDIETKVLSDPILDRVFTVQGKENEYRVTLPTGAVQKELGQNLDKSLPELTTILLYGTVVEINGRPILSKNQIQSLGMTDRRLLSEEIAKRNPGPKFTDISVTCPECGGEVVVPINLGTLFRF